MQVWLKQPLSPKEWGWANGQVGTPILGYPFNIQQGGRQRLILTQPTEACLRFFAERDDVQVNRVELALDIITPFASELKRAAKVGFMQRRHTTRDARRPRKMTIFPNDNFRTADLGHPGLSFQAYDDKPSKVTGEIDCFHLEAKVNGVRALRQLGVNSLSDLLLSIMLSSGNATSSSSKSTWRGSVVSTPTGVTEPSGDAPLVHRSGVDLSSTLTLRSGTCCFECLALFLMLPTIPKNPGPISRIARFSSSSKPTQTPWGLILM